MQGGPIQDIPLDGTTSGQLETVLDPEVHGRGVELSSINPAYQGKEHRYVYACGAQRPCNFFNSLTKIDLLEKGAKNWHEVGCAIRALLCGEARWNG